MNNVTIGALLVLVGMALGLFGPLRSLAPEQIFRQRVQIHTTVTVVDDNGSPLPNRLVVVFAEGREAGRTDASGRLRGLFPSSVQAIGDSVSIREGERLILSFPPDEQVVAYAFPGDSRSLPAAVTTCRLNYANDGTIRCPDCAVGTPGYAVWLMGLFLGMLVFLLATMAIRRVFPWPDGWDDLWRTIASYAAALSLTVATVLAFYERGEADRLLCQALDIFAPAATAILAAIGVAIGIQTVYAKLRGSRLW